MVHCSWTKKASFRIQSFCSKLLMNCVNWFGTPLLTRYCRLLPLRFVRFSTPSMVPV